MLIKRSILIKTIIAVLFTGVFCLKTYAAGKTSDVALIHAYSDRDSVIFTLVNKPSIPQAANCDSSNLSIVLDANVSNTRMQNMMAVLLSAKISSKRVRVIYSDTECNTINNQTYLKVERVTLN